MRKLVWKNLWQALAAVAFLTVVWAVAYYKTGNELLVPPLQESLRSVGELLTEGGFWLAFLASFLRATLAFAISFLAAAIFAVVAYLYPTFKGIFAPVASALRSLPVLAVLLILLSIFTANALPIAVAFLSLFPMLYAGILAALSGVDRQLIELAEVFGASKKRKVFSVYLPLSAPYIAREAGAAISFSLKLVISAEVLANTARSLGGMMQEASVYAEIARLFALVGVAFFAGLILELIAATFAEWIDGRIGK